ncbi:MAG: hypothetical protein D6805_09175 [Planctomycetota bacterium]|nr:MAG: hypothetical protein D6805_09175 [Planctomycetota bacterium]
MLPIHAIRRGFVPYCINVSKKKKTTFLTSLPCPLPPIYATPLLQNQPPLFRKKTLLKNGKKFFIIAPERTKGFKARTPQEKSSTPPEHFRAFLHPL